MHMPHITPKDRESSGTTQFIHPIKWGASKILQGMAATILTAFTLAHAGGYQRGPDPSTAMLEASSGPYTVASEKISSPVNYGGGTVYFPTATGDGPFGVVAFSPGFVNTEAANKWWGPALASHGFVVVMINTLTPFDLPGLRGRQLLAALKDIIARSQDKASAYFGRIDINRRAVMGHSMGGGGTLSASVSDPSLKAAIPLAPWSANTDWSKDSVPTLVIAGQNDVVAPPSTMASVFYNNLPGNLSKAYMEMKAADHFFPNNLGPTAMKPVMSKYAVSWLKRFLDEDRRYSQFLCGALHDADLNATNTQISTYKETCPY
ncbi:MAG TPA: alpha/beta hydrolase [Aquabacterium sp.]|uniref:alpha/beta hydrolase family protein n=1 Tax=Aquabacterium sp. TaxID=1872578 RepID=UPI002E31E9DA|nr:alpha/beta hydrolase [Aquabacterium sp.]HEX5357960.1 alpha/beta hydrolase [Aquabacterium sp.]